MPAPMLCTRCQVVDRPRAEMPGSGCVLVALLCLLVVPGLIYLAWMLSTRGEWKCPHCGSTELVPTDSPRAAAILSTMPPDAPGPPPLPAPPSLPELPRVPTATAAARALNRRPLIVVLVVVALALVVCSSGGRKVEAPAGAGRREPEPPRRAVYEPRAQPARIRVLAKGVALAEPRQGATPVLRLTAGESYARGELRGGWVRLDDAPVESWVLESSVEVFTPPPK